MASFVNGALEQCTTIHCIDGRMLDCIIDPIGGIGGVYIGCYEAAINYELLDRLKIRAVLSLDDQNEYCYFNTKVVSHRHYKIKDSESEEISQLLIPSIEFIDAQRKRTNILVNCFAGISRSSTITIGYLMAKANLSLMASYRHVKSRRNVIQPNKGFAQALLRFEEYLENECENKREVASVKLGSSPSVSKLY